MIVLTPAFLVGAAGAFIGLGEDSHTRGCRGAMVDHLTRRVRANPNAPWDAALVHHAGYWSHYDHRCCRSSWPIPPLASADALAAFARKTNVLDTRPEAGDVFVLWSGGRRRFIHTGIVLHVIGPGEFDSGRPFIECVVLSPNVHADGSIGGPSTVSLTRQMCPDTGDAFIRWAELDPKIGRQEGEGDESGAARTTVDPLPSPAGSLHREAA